MKSKSILLLVTSFMLMGCTNSANPVDSQQSTSENTKSESAEGGTGTLKVNFYNNSSFPTGNVLDNKEGFISAFNNGEKTGDLFRDNLSDVSCNDKTRVQIANNTSDRCTFDAGQAMQMYPKDKLLSEFARQFDSPAVQYIRKDSVRKVIEKAIIHHSSRMADELIANLADTASVKDRRLSIRATRNIPIHHAMPQLIDYVENKANEEFQLLIIEALGWHPLSYQNERISEAMLRIQKDARYSQAVRDEALKTYNRLHAK